MAYQMARDRGATDNTADALFLNLVTLLLNLCGPIVNDLESYSKIDLTVVKESASLHQLGISLSILLSSSFGNPTFFFLCLMVLFFF